MIEPLIQKAYGLRLYQEKKSWQYLPHEVLMEIQLAKFKKLLQMFCGETYYGRVLDDLSLTAAEISTIHRIEDVLPKLPLMTKEQILRHREDMVNPIARGIFPDSSGGSTGTPLNFYHDRNWAANVAATTLVSDTMQGWRPFRRHAKIWGASRDLREISSGAARLGNWIRKRRFYDSFDMSSERMQAFHNDLTLFKPEVIIGYASSVFVFAQFLEAATIVPTYPIRSIITTAERLDDIMRETIERVFGVPVFNRYGSREVGCIAGECEEHCGMHLHHYDHILECLNPDGSMAGEEPGELIITDLNNYAFPFVRYKIGDMGIVSPNKCTCGRGTPLLQKLVGRVGGTITTKCGRLIHGEFFTHLFYGVEGIRQFQFVQEDIDRYTLLVAPAISVGLINLDEAVERIREAVGSESTIDVCFVNEINSSASGKYQFTISKVPLRLLPKTTSG